MATIEMATTFIDTVLGRTYDTATRTHVDRWLVDLDGVSVVVTHEPVADSARVVVGSVVLDRRPGPERFDELAETLPFGRLRTIEDGRVVVEEAIPVDHLTGVLLAHAVSFVDWAAHTLAGLEEPSGTETGQDDASRASGVTPPTGTPPAAAPAAAAAAGSHAGHVPTAGYL